MGYLVSRCWQTDLEPGDWYEIVYDDEKRLIAGFVFIPPPLRAGVIQLREVDGKVIPRARWDKGWIDAIKRHNQKPPVLSRELGLMEAARELTGRLHISWDEAGEVLTKMSAKDGSMIMTGDGWQLIPSADPEHPDMFTLITSAREGQ